jgi:ATP-dependent DNA helicase Rep
MRERAKGPDRRAAKDVVVCTFHALGVRMVREDGKVLGLKPQFSILDQDDVLGILKDAAGGTTDAATARQWQWTISLWKNMGLNAAQALAQAKDDHERSIALMMQRYEERLTAYQSVDFDDLISLPLKLLRDHPEVRAKWQQQLGHVLVDEYQDTNATQYELLKLLVGERGRFTAVGDDDQSIYGWRGATLDNLKKLPVDYPQLKVIKLEQNYRSTSAILRAANNVIGPNPKLFPKTAVQRAGRGRTRARGGRRQRGARGRARRGAPAGPARRRQPAAGLEELRHPVPRQPPGQAVRKSAAQGQHPVQGVGRNELF